MSLRILFGLILTASILTVSCPFAVAKQGGTDSGGGSKIKKDFVQRVEALIGRLQGMKDAVALAYADRFQRTLRDPDFKIDVVEILLDPHTGKPVANQRPLYAYGARNYIQLKSTPRDDDGAESWEKKINTGGNLDPDVFHEMAWAATGNDADRDYQISVARLKLHVKNGLQLGRLKLLRPEVYYTNRNTKLDCIYHVEVDETARSFVMSGLAPGRVSQLDSCSQVFRFTYEEERDLWIAVYDEPLAVDGKGQVGIQILPDGNFLIDKAADMKQGSPDYRKFVALRADDAFTLEGASQRVGGACAPLEWKASELLLSKLNEQAILQGRSSCESLFHKCKMVDLHSEQRSEGGPILSCARIAVFTGVEPRL